MHLIQLLLPLQDDEGSAFPSKLFDGVHAELTDRFGGVTAFRQPPAEGAWEQEDERVRHDRMVIYEVMADAVDRGWWADYRRDLEGPFEQEELVVRTRRSSACSEWVRFSKRYARSYHPRWCEDDGDATPLTGGSARGRRSEAPRRGAPALLSSHRPDGGAAKRDRRSRIWSLK